MDKMDMDIYYVKFKNSPDKIITFIGSENGIAKLKNVLCDFNNGKVKSSDVAECVVENEIYCNICCEYEDFISEKNIIFTNEDLNKLNDYDLLINSELAFEAMVLKNRDKINDAMSFIEDEMGRSKEDIDKIFSESMWLYKFEV